MKNKHNSAGIWAFLGIFLLILDGKTAISGAQSGLKLCIHTVIPSLFPFILLTNILSGALIGTSIPLLKPAAHKMGIPDGGESLLVPIFLGGYPLGAAAVGSAYQKGELSRKSAERMLYFCSNAGPAFVFGVLSAVFPEQSYLWAMWGIHILSAFLIALWIPKSPDKAAVSGHSVTLPEAMNGAVRTIASICGWILCFRVILAAADHWILRLFPHWLQIFLTGSLELTNGCLRLKELTALPLRFSMACVLLSAGGLCVFMQTSSVIGDLDIRNYMAGKALQAGLSLLFSLCFLWNTAIFFGLVFCFLAVSAIPSQKRSRKSLSYGV